MDEWKSISIIVIRVTAARHADALLITTTLCDYKYGSMSTKIFRKLIIIPDHILKLNGITTKCRQRAYGRCSG